MKKTKAHRVIPKSDMLFDEAVKAFVWVCKTNPRVSDVIRYYKKHNFAGRFDAKDVFLFAFESGYNPSGFAEKLLAKGHKLDRNFERNVLRFHKKCGMGDVKELKAKISAIVARECGKPHTFVPCGNNCVIRTGPKKK